MPKFTYRLITKKDKIKEGTISALSKKKAEEKLSGDGSTILLLSREGSSFLKTDLLSFITGFSQSERIIFFRNLSIMIQSGLSIAEALGILSEQVKSSKVKKAITKIANEVRDGKKLSESMARYPKYFPEYLTETVNMGNVSGRLSEVLDRISDDLEKDYELKRKISAAIAYPVIVTVAMLAVAVGLSFFILPLIEELFVEFGAPLPFLTRIILSGGKFLRAYPFIILGVMAGIIVFFSLLLKNERGRYAVHYLFLKFPVFGDLIKEYHLVLFFRSIESVVMSGMSLAEAVKIAKKTLTNDVFKKALDNIYPNLIHGTPLSETLAPFSSLFPVQTQRIVAVGERTGASEEIFKRITGHYERSVDYKTRMMTVLIEPMLIAMLGVVIAGLALSIFLPIYQVANVI